MSTTKTPEPKTPEVDESGQAPPAGGSSGPPPSVSPWEPAPEDKQDDKHKDDKHKDEKAHK